MRQDSTALSSRLERVRCRDVDVPPNGLIQTISELRTPDAAKHCVAADAVVSAVAADLGKDPAEVWGDLDWGMASELGRVGIAL